MTEVDEKDEIVLARILYIHLLFCFHKQKKNKIQAPINSDSQINFITLTYISKVGFKACQTDVEAQIINGSIISIFRMLLANIYIKDKFRKAQFFQNTFTLADINIKMILEIGFLILNNINIELAKK